jgi:hypothetical protein
MKTRRPTCARRWECEAFREAAAELLAAREAMVPIQAMYDDYDYRPELEPWDDQVFEPALKRYLAADERVREAMRADGIHVASYRGTIFADLYGGDPLYAIGDNGANIDVCVLSLDDVYEAD